MSANTAVIVDNNPRYLEFFEDVLRNHDESVRCVSFIYGDEAIDLINHDLASAPSYIFLDANLKRIPIGKCLSELRSNPSLDQTCIIVVSSVMPTVVADVYCDMGADFAFPKPLTRMEGDEMLDIIMHNNPRGLAEILKA